MSITYIDKDLETAQYRLENQRLKKALNLIITYETGPVGNGYEYPEYIAQRALNKKLRRRGEK